MTKSANRLFSISAAGTIVAAVPGSSFRILYINATANNNNAAADGIMVAIATVNGVATDLFDIRVPIGANIFAVISSTKCDIICDANTAITVAIFGTITFNLQMAGVYE